MIYYLPLIYYHFSKILSEHLQCTQPYATHHTGVREARGWSQAPKSCLSPAEMLANWQLDKISRPQIGHPRSHHHLSHWEHLDPLHQQSPCWEVGRTG